MEIPKFSELGRAPDRRKTVRDTDIEAIRSRHAKGATHKHLCIDFPHLSSATVWRVMNNMLRKSDQGNKPLVSKKKQA